MTVNRRRDNTPHMMLRGTPSLHTTSPRSTILINPFRSRDTGIEARARTTLPAGNTVLVVVIEGDEMGCVARRSSDQTEEEGEKGKAMDDHCCGNFDKGDCCDMYLGYELLDMSGARETLYPVFRFRENAG
jgi:hypothetical protein